MPSAPALVVAIATGALEIQHILQDCKKISKNTYDVDALYMYYVTCFQIQKVQLMKNK
jgi:hypothetical protein